MDDGTGESTQAVDETIAESRYLDGLEQMRAVSNKIRRRILQLLVDEPMTVTQIGKALEMPPPTAHYHVRELVRVGLVRLAETKERRGILEKYYRAVARHFLLPKEPLRGQTPTEQLATVSELLDDISRHVTSVISAYGRGDEQPDAVQLSVQVVFLRPGDVAELSAKLAELIAPFRAPRDDSIDREHIVMQLAVPTHARHAEEPQQREEEKNS